METPEQRFTYRVKSGAASQMRNILHASIINHGIKQYHEGKRCRIVIGFDRWKCIKSTAKVEPTDRLYAVIVEDEEKNDYFILESLLDQLSAKEYIRP